MKGAKKSENEEITERYLMQCEKSIESAKREHLPKIHQKKLDKQKRQRHDKARAKADSPMKSPETAVPTPHMTTPCASTSTMTVARTKGKEEGGEQKRQKDKKGDADEVCSLALDLDSNSGMIFDWPT